MKLNKSEFGKMLAKKLDETNDVVALSRWAYELFMDFQRDAEPGLRDLLLELSRMEDSPEFEYSVVELRKLAETLQHRKQ